MEGGDRHGVNRGPSSKLFKNPLKESFASFLCMQAGMGLCTEQC